MEKIQANYKKLLELSKKIALLNSISYLLEWDQETYMPEKGSLVRAEQIELMASLTHKEKTSKAFGKLLDQLIDIDSGEYKVQDLNHLQKATVREWRKEYLKSIRLPNQFVKKFAKLTSESMTVWATARKENNFKLFSPYLAKIIEMCIQKANFLGFQDHPYDALLDIYEPGMKTKNVDIVFSDLKEKITTLLKKIQSSPQVNDDFLFGNFSKEKQLEFSHILLDALGYDLKKGRLDLSNHPFSTSLHPFDSRITTRLHHSSLMDCSSAVLHEAGHSLYEMGMLPENYGTPLAEAISLGIHESQSRWWETRIGQNLSFWKHFFPIMQKIFHDSLKKVSLENFYKAINKVSATPIRIESDEVTYSLHVILRFEIEKELISESLRVDEIPDAWNEKLNKYLGIKPKNDAEGCLQDIHWSMGGFGYFPTYTLGNLYASQFFEAFEKQYPDWEKRIEKGEFGFIKNWLNENIHKHGKYYSATDLCMHVTGKKISSEPFVAYLNKKYEEIYRFS